MKSIAIIGKGPSISKCKREFIEKYEEVAICGRPIFSKYEHLIGNRADLDFCNCGDARIYQKNRMKDLGIRKVINTNKPIARKNINPISSIICPYGVDYDPNGRVKVIDKFKIYNLDPSTGTIALQYILDMNKYNKIGIFGFDLMEVGEDVYYFPKNQVQTSLQRLYTIGIYNPKNGKRISKTAHDLDKTMRYMIDVIKKNKDIKFEILSNREFPKLSNIHQI